MNLLVVGVKNWMVIDVFRKLIVALGGWIAGWSLPVGAQVYQIERVESGPYPPLGQADMARLARGEPPAVVFPWSLDLSSRSGYFHHCRSDGGIPYCMNPSPRFRVDLFREMDPGSPDLLKLRDGQGARVYRGADGQISMVSSMMDWFFIRRTPESYKILRYPGGNCGTAADGSPMVLPGSVMKSSVEITRGLPALKDGTGQILLRSVIWGTNYLAVFDFEENKDRSQVIRHNYKGEIEVPSALYARGVLQRIFWPEGPGFKQIEKAERMQADRSWKLEGHYVTNWKADANGTLHLASKENLLLPEGGKKDPQEEEKAPDESNEEFN